MKKIFIDTGRRSERVVYEEYSVESNFIQAYVSANEVFYKVQSPCAYALMMWCMINMDKFNHITLNKYMRSELISDIVSMGGKRYSDNTVKDAISVLVKANVLISFNEENEREATYMVNPSYYWKSKNQKDRLESIKAYENRKRDNERNSI